MVFMTNLLMRYMVLNARLYDGLRGFWSALARFTADVDFMQSNLPGLLGEKSIVFEKSVPLISIYHFRETTSPIEPFIPAPFVCSIDPVV